MCARYKCSAKTTLEFYTYRRDYLDNKPVFYARHFVWNYDKNTFSNKEMYFLKNCVMYYK